MTTAQFWIFLLALYTLPGATLALLGPILYRGDDE